MKIDLSISEPFKFTTFNMDIFEASKSGNLEVVKVLLKSGADVNVKDNWGWTPLMWECSYGHLEVVKFLLKNGADVNVKSNYGSTPLVAACRYGHLEVAKVILGHMISPYVHGKTVFRRYERALGIVKYMGPNKIFEFTDDVSTSIAALQIESA